MVRGGGRDGVPDFWEIIVYPGWFAATTAVGAAALVAAVRRSAVRVSLVNPCAGSFQELVAAWYDAFFVFCAIGMALIVFVIAISMRYLI